VNILNEFNIPKSIKELPVGTVAIPGPKPIAPKVVNILPSTLQSAHIAIAAPREIMVPFITVLAPKPTAPSEIQNTLEADAPLFK
jgi:hypothetical protein